MYSVLLVITAIQKERRLSLQRKNRLMSAIINMNRTDDQVLKTFKQKAVLSTASV